MVINVRLIPLQFLMAAPVGQTVNVKATIVILRKIQNSVPEFANQLQAQVLLRLNPLLRG